MTTNPYNHRRGPAILGPGVLGALQRLSLVACLGLIVGCGDDTAGADAGSGTPDGALDGGGHQDAGADGALDATVDAGPDPETLPAGLFLSRAGLIRARSRAASDAEPFRTQAQLIAGRAASAAEASTIFHMEDLRSIRFGWCEADDDVPDTLSELTDQLAIESDRVRTLALSFAVLEDAEDGALALARLRSVAEEFTLCNLHDLDVVFADAQLADQTEGYCSDRPWNFALDTMWQAYGLMNIADAYLLLSRNGATISEDDDATARDLILRLAEAVNSSFLAWTRWADAHPSSGSYERYRSDNHLSWALTGLLAAAVALEDETLAAYVLEGGSWTDSRSGAYANPSPIHTLIDLAIEADGRIYEERILRDPPVGYSFFHLWAMSVVALMAEIHYGEDVWSDVGDDGAGLRTAYDRYGPYILGTATSPEPDQEPDLGNYRWLYELAVRRWDDAAHWEVLADARGGWIIQSIGPVALLLGPDPS